jgi:galactokinase
MLRPIGHSRKIHAGEYDAVFRRLYPGRDITAVRERYLSATKAFAANFGDRSASIFSAPGRSEICGNHTDHQRGRVLACAVDLDLLCVVSKSDNHRIKIISEGYAPLEISIDKLEPRDSEKGTSEALIRGVAARFNELGYKTGGFDAYMTSNIPSGSGLSSSAAYEVAIGHIFSALFKNNVSPTEIAKIGQYAENVYFGKPSGLMDQMASSVGGLIEIDFEKAEEPRVTGIECDFASNGLSLCITDTKGSHADLTPDYAAIREDLLAVSRFFGKEVLREVDEKVFFGKLNELRITAGDRAVLRAIHVYRENTLVETAVKALQEENIKLFLDCLVKSGRSSSMNLQNVFSPSNPKEQGLPIALALSAQILGRNGAWRVQGGGFAGTILAFVPKGKLRDYIARMNAVFGENACNALSVRPVGGTEIKAGG